MKKEKNAIDKKGGIPLLWGEALRSFLCMVPMLVAVIFSQNSHIVSLGQGGFFFGLIPIPQARGKRVLISSLLIALGLGFYLMGGNVVFNPWLAVIFTFFVAFNIGLLSGYAVIGLLAIHFISIYTAGLNANSFEAVHANFFDFICAMGWGALISILFNWKEQSSKEPPQENIRNYFVSGIRMGFATSIALGVSYLFGFAKLGWAPSGAGLIIRYDTKLSKMLAWARFVATIAGAALAILCFYISLNFQFLIVMSVLFAVLNGLFKATKIGKMPLFYTATILILYSIVSPVSNASLVSERIFYNIVGITIGLLFILYPFPIITKSIFQRMKVPIKTDIKS